ncbi:hypothetical protein QM306_39955, partial [Burkholderia cenocepacia]|nr:hypothetical protein [Burkholderia cenocepacia]
VLNGKLGQATVERDGLRLTFRRAAGAAAPKRPQIDAPSYMWMEGGDMKMFNVLELNVRALIRNSAEPCATWLRYPYRSNRIGPASAEFRI